MEYSRTSSFRPIPQPSIPLPFGLRSIGHGRVKAKWHDYQPPRNLLQLFWGIEGRARIRLDGTWHLLPPRSVFFYFPLDIHELRAETDWEHRWLTLDGPLCMENVKALGLDRGITPAGDCPEDLFILLTGKTYDISPAGQRENAALAFRILTLACGSPATAAEDSPLWLLKAVEIIQRNYADPRHNINFIADQVGVHRTTLSRAFQRYKGISANHYLRSCRVQKALSLLKETKLNIAEISYRCGFNDPDHFSTVIRRATGLSPTKFRRG